MPMLLGIDTGGTFTDAVLLDDAVGIIAKAKAHTTGYDLTVGIQNALSGLFSQHKPHIHLVSLSSTLATNAIVEGKGSPACLILIGYDPDILKSDIFQKIRSENPVVFIQGGHRISGDEQAPLDEKGLKDAIKAHMGSVKSFAVSGYFSVRNPSHELKAKAIIRNITGLAVTCGHELTRHLDAPRRAVTTLLNARLIPLIYDLIGSVEKVLADFDIQAPLMIVKGDGSLISARAALDVPVETILSGPAASIVGARYLAHLNDALIIDMGGTTSDVAMLKGWATIITENRTTVGDFHPMVESMDILTEGIGGDSWIQINTNSALEIGPARVVPLCMLADSYPAVVELMKSCLLDFRSGGLPFFIFQEHSAETQKSLSDVCREILDWTSDGPLCIPKILEKVSYPSVYAQAIEFLMKERLVSTSSFTPTDAVNVSGHYSTGNAEAAKAGAEMMAVRLGMDVNVFCNTVLEQVRYRLASAIVRCALRADNASEKIAAQAADSFFIDRALKKNAKDLVKCSFSLGCPIVGVGAPAETYLPDAASLLNCNILVPENAEVANAVGAVTGVISQTVHILIKPIKGGALFRVHMPEAISDFEKYEDAEAFAIETAAKIAGEKAQRAGADQFEIDVAKKDYGIKKSPSAKPQEIVIETEIIATASARPRMGA